MTSVVIVVQTDLQAAGHVAGGWVLARFALIVVAVAFSRVVRQAKAESGEDG